MQQERRIEETDLGDDHVLVAVRSAMNGQSRGVLGAVSLFSSRRCDDARVLTRASS